MEASWGNLGSFGGILRASWVVLRGSWVILGGSLALLGGLGCLLGGSWSILGAHGSTFVVLGSTRRSAGSELGRFGDPRWSQKSTPNRPKSKTKTMRKTSRSRRPSWSDLGGILGRFWATPISKIVLSPRAGLVFLKIRVFEKVRCQEATWAELEPTWAPKGPQKGAQEGAKTRQKTRRKVK